MRYVDPIEITDALLLSTTVPEDPTPAWAAGTFTVKQEVHVPATHRVYRDAVGGSSSISPDLDPDRWQDMRPTNRMAPFDLYADTVATSTTQNLTWVFKGRFVNTIRVDALMGASVTVSIKSAVGGPVIFSKTVRLKAGALGYWDYAYGQRYYKDSVLFTGLPIAPAAEITVTVTASGSAVRAIGSIDMGKLANLLGGGFGGVLWDVSAIPKTFTYREIQLDGTVKWVPRASATDLRGTCAFDCAFADGAVAQLKRLLKKPVVWIPNVKPGFSGLIVKGFLTQGEVKYLSSKRAEIPFFVEGQA